jgi:hypothetical protein
MASRILPGLGLRGFWDYEEDGWHGDPGMDGNLRRLSALTQLSVLDQDLIEAPIEAANGDIYIVGQGATGVWVGQDGKIAVRDNGAWVYLDALTGLIAYVQDEQTYYRYDAGWFSLVQAQTFSAYCNYRQVFGAAATWTLVPTNNARHNDQGVWSAGTGLFTAPVNGYYSFSGFWTFDSESSHPSFIAAGFSINGADPNPDTEQRYTGTLTSMEASVSVANVLKLTAGDTVGLMGYISSGGAAMLADRNCFAGFKIS